VLAVVRYYVPSEDAMTAGFGSMNWVLLASKNRFAPLCLDCNQASSGIPTLRVILDYG